MGRGRGRRYFRFGSFGDDSGTEEFRVDEFEIFSLQEDGVTPTTFENAIEINGTRQRLSTSFTSNPAIIEYEVTTSFNDPILFELEDQDGDISNGFQVGELEIDVDRALNDLDYIIEENLIGLAEVTNRFEESFDTGNGSEFIDGFFSSENISLDTAFDDFASTEAGQSITIDVLANDLDVDDDDGFEFSANPSSSEGGTVEIEQGQILFTPGEDFVGTDSFTYDLLSQDGEARVIDTGTVTVEVSESLNQPTPESPRVSLEAIFGTLNGDIIEIQGSNQLIFTGGSEDLVDAFTGDGNNRIYAGNGDDTLILGERDRAFGGEGNDRFFVTNGGNNTLTGGEGADQFWITTAEIPDATNTVTDFTIGEDVIGIAGLGIGFEDVNLTQNEDDVLISNTGNDLAVLEDIDITNLNESDFAFA